MHGAKYMKFQHRSCHWLLLQGESENQQWVLKLREMDWWQVCEANQQWVLKLREMNWWQVCEANQQWVLKLREMNWWEVCEANDWETNFYTFSLLWIIINLFEDMELCIWWTDTDVSKEFFNYLQGRTLRYRRTERNGTVRYGTAFYQRSLQSYFHCQGNFKFYSSHM